MGWSFATDSKSYVLALALHALLHCSSTLLYLLTCALHDGRQQVASGVSSNRSFGAVPSTIVLADSVA